MPAEAGAWGGCSQVPVRRARPRPRNPSRLLFRACSIDAKDWDALDWVATTVYSSSGKPIQAQHAELPGDDPYRSAPAAARRPARARVAWGLSLHCTVLCSTTLELLLHLPAYSHSVHSPPCPIRVQPRRARHALARGPHLLHLPCARAPRLG